MSFENTSWMQPLLKLTTETQSAQRFLADGFKVFQRDFRIDILRVLFQINQILVLISKTI